MKKIIREKCTDKQWCSWLAHCMTGANRKGINPVEVFSLKTGKVRVAAVAFKKTERDRGVCFNFCPFCGKDISPSKQSSKPTLTKKEPRPCLNQ